MNANIRSLDLTQLLTLDALYRERSVTRAADVVGLSQPAVSGILNRLRDLFEDELYTRTSHGVVPTPRADALAPQVKQVIRATQGLFEQETFDPAQDAFDITLAGSDYVSRTLFGPLVGALRRAAPRLRISIYRPASGMFGHQQVLDEVDMLLTSHDPQGKPQEGELIFSDTLVCVSSYAAHRDGQHIDLKELCALDNIIGQLPMRSSVSERLQAALRAQGLSRNIALDAPDFASVFRFMKHTELVSFLPAKLVQQQGSDLKRLRVDLDIPAANVHARWHPRLANDPRHLWLLDQVRQVARSLA